MVPVPSATLFDSVMPHPSSVLSDSVMPASGLSIASSFSSASSTVSPLTTIFVILVCVSRIVRRTLLSVVSNVAFIKIRLEIPLSATVIFPSSISLCAQTLSAGVTFARDSRPLSGFPATYPSAAAKTFPTSLELGIPQVKAFLYMPLFIATFK